jgi:hypothetical protein
MMTSLFLTASLLAMGLRGCNAATSTLFNMITPSGVSRATSTFGVTLGVQFSPTVDGQATAVLFLKSESSSNNRVCLLHTTGRTELARVTLPQANETRDGEWQICRFTSPVSLSANQDYIASIWTTKYARSMSWFSSRDVRSGDLLLRSSYFNGRYSYGSSPVFPDTSYNTNYWVDVRFETPTKPPTPLPTLFPTPFPTPPPTPAPTPEPTLSPTPPPTASPTPNPTPIPTPEPSPESTTDRSTTLSISSAPEQTLPNVDSLLSTTTTLATISTASASENATAVAETSATVNVDNVAPSSDVPMWIGIGV